MIPGPRQGLRPLPRAWALYERPALRAGLRRGECNSPLHRNLTLPQILILPLTPAPVSRIYKQPE